MVEQPLNFANSYKLVNDYWNKNEEWKWEEVQSFLPQHVFSKLTSILLREDEANINSLCWSPSPNGRFSISSAYNLVDGVIQPTIEDRWGIIWKLSVPQRVIMLMWVILDPWKGPVQRGEVSKRNGTNHILPTLPA